MPKIDISKAPVRTTTVYPKEFKHVCHGREKAALGNVAGLTQFGVNLHASSRVQPPRYATGMRTKTSSFT